MQNDQSESSRQSSNGPANADPFVRLLMQHDRKIRAFLRSLLPSAADVDEVMQEVSVIAWRKFDQLNHPENFARWISVIAHYEVLTFRRNKARDRLVLDDELLNLIANEGFEELGKRNEQLEALEICLNQLPPARKELVLKIYAAESPMKTIASKIGKTPDALYQIVSRLRRDLMACMARQADAQSLLDSNQQ